MYKTLLSNVDNQIAEIVFNRPNQMNSFDDTMAQELAELTEKIANSSNIRAVLLKGSGHLFMAGGDIQFFHKNLENLPSGVKKIVRTLNISIINLMRMPKPILASVHGSVAGVGMSLMMASDLVIAANTTKFTMAYSGLGISPDGGASYNLPRIVGTKKAMELLLFPDLIDAESAKQMGLINWVVHNDQLESETRRILERLVHGPTQSYSHTKKLVNTSWQNSLESQLESESESFEFCSGTQDFKAGVVGFLKKEKPEFVGS